MSSMTLQEAIELLNLESVRADDGSVSISEESLRKLAAQQGEQRRVDQEKMMAAPKNIEEARQLAREYLREQNGPQHMPGPGRSVPANQPSAVEGV
jgi:hypothetical protein